MIKVLVTGANGQLGRTIQKYKENYKGVEFIFCDSKELDITNKDSIASVFNKYKFDCCINCAAYTNVEQAEAKPEKAFLVNAEGVKNLAQVCKLHKVTLVHISTDYVFDGNKLTPYRIDDLPNPINEYGKSKLKGEQFIQEQLEEYFIIRTSWLYSREFGKNFYRTILEKAKKEKELFITDAQTGCPTDTQNLTEYILMLILREYREKYYGIHHFCDKEILTWYSFAKKIIEENHLKDLKITKDNSYKTLAIRPKYSVLMQSL
ncbi:dTDP-4-dehydrorhamnose reductase [Joostella sp.]|uniref:dTDP-4-dehydrorhamnose reductase n=1 Tax=Joostella sp. TaxID=2231138 RepID=UPI003A8D94E3